MADKALHKIRNINRIILTASLIFFLPFLCFSQDTTIVISEIKVDRIILTGNKKTKPYIIYRELLFSEGDIIRTDTSADIIRRSEENLMNTGLFNFAVIHVYKSSDGHADVHIELTERWYLFPLPIFEIADRNFNEWWLTRDFKRTNYGMYIKQENFRGRDEILSLQFLNGYSQRLGLFYTIPYINRKQNIGLSTGLFITRNHEIAVNSIGNKLVYYKNPDEFVRYDFQAYVRISKRKGTDHFYYTTLDYRQTITDDSVLILNNEFFTDDVPEQEHLAIGWAYRFDRRDYQAYANKGFLFELEAAKVGLGILPHEPNLILMIAGIRKYQPLGEKFNASAMLKGRIMQYLPGPYFNQRALGYLQDYVRGYEYYVVNGQNFALFRSSLKYNLLPTKIYRIHWIKSEKFSKIPVTINLTGFYDTGYVRDRKYADRNPLSNEWQYGYGAGIDYVTYYDLVFRFEYAWNRMGENGFYFHLGAAF